MDEHTGEARRATIKRREAMRIIGTAATGLAAGCAASQAYSAEDPHGGQEKNMGPVNKPQHYICGFHVAKANPRFQIETQHYCSMLNEDVHQCLLYDSTEENAKLLGVEYIISDKLYRQLPKKEKKFFGILTRTRCSPVCWWRPTCPPRRSKNSCGP